MSTPDIRPITDQVWPPAPGALPFWRAYDDSRGADSSPYGYGDTEQEAIDDLRRQIEDMFGC